MEDETALQQAAAALRRGDASGARADLDALHAGGHRSLAAALLLAQACNKLGDGDAERAALDAALAIDKRNLPALLLMGDATARSGDDRAAHAFYHAALNQAGVTRDVPAALAPLLARARDFIAAASGRFEAHLLDRLGGAPSSGRLRQSLDLLLGKEKLFLQEPSIFYFPGLPQRQFYERAEFDWIPAIEAAVPAMQEELAGVLAGGEDFAPYVASSADRPRPNNPLLDDPSWGAFYFWKNGTLIAENAARCPRTMATLGAAPIPVIDSRSPMALWSLLKPGTHIQPHNGMLNTRLICHVPLMVPEGCALRVGSETRAWREGEALIFDDSIEHEAWNQGTSKRVVLLFEVWRPEIGLEERQWLTTLFEAINEYQGAPDMTA